jgi:hypothetical protein
MVFFFQFKSEYDVSLKVLWGILIFLYMSIYNHVSAKEHVIGWYSTGPKLRDNDLEVHRLFHK